jgi:hypothetical protein
MYTIPLALFLSIVNWTEFGMTLAAISIGSALICLQVEWARNILIGLYIVIGFWLIMASY